MSRKIGRKKEGRTRDMVLFLERTMDSGKKRRLMVVKKRRKMIGCGDVDGRSMSGEGVDAARIASPRL